MVFLATDNHASFTNEVMDVYSVNVSAAHFLSDAQRQALADDLFGDEAPAEKEPIKVNLR